MASASLTRPSRRAASKRNVVHDESDDVTIPNAQQDQGGDDDDEGDFTPAPQRSPRRQTRRKTTDVPPTPRTAARNRKARTGEGIEPSEIFDHEETLSAAPASPTKTLSPRKRKSVAPAKKRLPSVSLELSQLPTPEASVTPEPIQRSTPLGDITEGTINEKIAPAEIQGEILKHRSLDTVLEKPMDIVVRTRALGIQPIQEPIGSRSRTVIRYLVLTNFKSYAGRQEVGPFHASFSSVVGPNGSGKSNVIDSLLFVFGFRASKMRQGKISALIHNSAAFPNLDFCEVEVHFQEVIDLVGTYVHCRVGQ